MKEMWGLTVVLVFILQTGGVITRAFYNKPGDKVTLPCDASTLRSCSNVNWHNKRDLYALKETKVVAGQVKDPQQANRLEVSIDCSLIITNISREDAGLYICQRGDNNNTAVLNVLSIDLSGPDEDTAHDGVVDITCSVWRYPGNVSYPNWSLRLVDERGTVLTEEKCPNKQESCFSQKYQRHKNENNSRYTCQFLQDDRVEIEDHYTFVSGGADSNQSIIIIVVTLIAGVMLILFIISAIFIKSRRRTRVQEVQTQKDIKNSNHESDCNEEGPNNLTYATVDHSRSKACGKKKVKKEEDTVTYSAVRIKMDDSSNALELHQ